MKKKIITTAFLGLTTFAATPVFATEQIAYSLFGDPTYLNACSQCHTNGNSNNSDKGNLMPAAKLAYNQDKWGLSGLKTFVTASAPVVPAAPAPKTCASPQVLDTTTNSCFTPVPICNGGQILNATKDACVTPAPKVPVCKSTEVLTANVCVAKPVPVVVPKCKITEVLTANVCVAKPVPVVVPKCKSTEVLTANVCVAKPVPVVVPKCKSTEVLTANVCVAKPVPVFVPKCKSTEVLTANVCIAKPVGATAPKTPVCKSTQILNTTKTACVAKIKNTKPLLNGVAQQWDATVGEPFTIPLSVIDAEQDEFMITGRVFGSKFSEVHPDAAGLPSIDFTWTPAANQANKIFTITFQARETKTNPKLVSNRMRVKIRVWAAGDKNAASITKLKVIKSKWSAGTLNLAGSVRFNRVLTSAEKRDFIAQKLDLTVSGSNGALVGVAALTLNSRGTWSAAMPVAQTPCDIILQFEGQNAARTVAGCVNPVAVIATPIIVANNSTLFKNGESEREGNEGGEHESNEHEGGERENGGDRD